MTRARTGSTRSKRHKKIRVAAKGFKHARRKRVKVAKEALLHAGQHAYIGRKEKKRTLRRLWITRLNAAVREHGMKYSEFIKELKDNKIDLDRKILSEIAVNDPKTFKKIVDKLN